MVKTNAKESGPLLMGSALYSTHQNHIDREGLRLNFGHLVTCYTNQRCLRCFDVFASRGLPCEQRLHFRGMSWRAKSSYYRENVAFARRVLGDSPFFCFELFGRLRSRQQRMNINEYNCISANIVHEVLKHVSDISWVYVIHI